jgi:hypothetical protein
MNWGKGLERVSMLVIIVALAGCASGVMKQYVGKDIREVYMEHGKPANTFDMDDGRRVFQFNWGESSSGSPYGQKGGCLLSYITRATPANNSWIVEEYRYPERLVC